MKIEPRFKPLPPEPATLLTEGRLAEAVRVLRTSEDISLARAKQWIAWHVAQDPMLGVQLEVQRRAARRRFFLWFLLVDALIAAAIIYYLFYLKP
ncbi:MAG TPA: hypothetical protein VJP84_16250 [Steroidobacteraceae bacterium]|jgi:hypothetical protein|nr:hypothetical protein [Steroidobacteraceae bacterium]